MALLAAILLAIFVVPSPWGVAVIAVGVLWEAGESLFWIRWSQRRRAQVGAETLVGTTVRVVAPLAPEGKVQVKGELWRARCEGEAEVGEEVRVTAVEGLRLRVQQVRAGASSAGRPA